MTTTKHTPGPWKAYGPMGDGRGGRTIEIGAETPAGHMSVAWVMLGKTPTPLAVNEGMADARLLAAAPELLEALRFVLAHAFEAKWAGDERALDLVEAAIAKATGGSP